MCSIWERSFKSTYPKKSVKLNILIVIFNEASKSQITKNSHCPNAHVPVLDVAAEVLKIWKTIKNH